jgi:hypothetical protein
VLDLLVVRFLLCRDLESIFYERMFGYDWAAINSVSELTALELTRYGRRAGAMPFPQRPCPKSRLGHDSAEQLPQLRHGLSVARVQTLCKVVGK